MLLLLLLLLLFVKIANNFIYYLEVLSIIYRVILKFITRHLLTINTLFSILLKLKQQFSYLLLLFKKKNAKI